jgi:hypothetical protein
LWTNMTGYKSDEVVGKLSCSILQSADTDTLAVEAMMNEIRVKRSATAVLVNKSKSGELFTNSLVVYPLCTDSRITFYLGLTLYSMVGKPTSVETSTMMAIKTTISQAHNSLITSEELKAQATVTTETSDAGLSVPTINRSQYDLMGVLAGKVGNDVGIKMPLPTTV